MPKISIITPCYNSERYVGKTIESVRAQTFTDWEHIVVDDGSTDGSAVAVEALLPDDPRLRLIRKANGGVASARNAGFRAADRESECLLFLDADDCLEPEMLETMVRYLDSHPSVGFVHCAFRFIDADGCLLSPDSHEKGWTPRYVPTGLGVSTLPEEHTETPFVSVFSLAGIVPSLVVIRRSAYQETKGWDEEFGQHYEDTDLLLNIAIRHTVHYLPRPLVRYRKHSAQNTADASRFGNQEQKLYEKWLTKTDLTAMQRAIIQEAWRFRQGRLVPYTGVQAAVRHLRAGQVSQAMRFFGGAARRYALSFFPGSAGEARA